VKNKIRSTLVQLTVIFLIQQNEQQRNLKDSKKREAQSIYFNKFFCLL